MNFLNKIDLRVILYFGIVAHVYSDKPIISTLAQIKNLTANETITSNAPLYFPLANNMTVNETELPMSTFKSITVPSSSQLCWPNISRAFWATMLHHDKKITGSHYQKLLSKYKELTRNFNEQIMQMISTADEMRSLINYNSTEEEIIEAKVKERLRQLQGSASQANSTETPKNCTCQEKVNVDSRDVEKDIPEDDSFYRSITVPILLIVILMLLTYIAFLYRKLQFARYKDAQILVQDELSEPWAAR